MVPSYDFTFSCLLENPSGVKATKLSGDEFGYPEIPKFESTQRYILMESLAFASNTARPPWKAFPRDLDRFSPHLYIQGKGDESVFVFFTFFLSKMLPFFTIFLPNTYYETYGFPFSRMAKNLLEVCSVMTRK